jgi:hypothetical protein
MASYKPFGYTGEEDTCLWCGTKLRHDRLPATDADKDNPTYRPGKNAWGGATIISPVPGYESNGYFDTLSCGYNFGREIAALGERLELNKTPG